MNDFILDIIVYPKNVYTFFGYTIFSYQNRLLLVYEKILLLTSIIFRGVTQRALLNFIWVKCVTQFNFNIRQTQINLFKESICLHESHLYLNQSLENYCELNASQIVFLNCNTPFYFCLVARSVNQNRHGVVH